MATKVQDYQHKSQAQILDGILKHLPVLVFRIDSEGRWTEAQGFGINRLGLKPEDVIGVKVLDLFPDVKKDVEKALAGETVVCESHGMSPNGEPWWLQNYVFADEVQGSGLIGFAFDITDLKLEEQERQKLEGQVQHAQKLESLGVLAGGIAHDFNNFLLGILGNASLARQVIPSDHPALRYVEQIQCAAEKATDICKSMLDYAGRNTTTRRSVSLTHLVLDNLEFLKVSVSKNVTLCTCLPEQELHIEGDTSQVQQVLLNLVINAAEAIGNKSGRVTISVDTIQADSHLASNIYLRENIAPGSYVCLGVQDTGEGFDSKTKEKIFDPFYSTKFSGRGLGLATVLGIVRSHRGAIQVDSRPGYGTKFLVFFRQAENTAHKESPRTGAPINLPPQEKGRIALVIDDDKISQMVIEQMLCAKGFSVMTADDGEAGLEALKSNQSPVSLVVLDMTMPKLSGDTVLEQIRQSDKDIPVLLTSAHNRRDCLEHFDQDQVHTSFLQKPYDIDTFTKALSSLGAH